MRAAGSDVNLQVGVSAVLGEVSDRRHRETWQWVREGWVDTESARLSRASPDTGEHPQGVASTAAGTPGCQCTGTGRRQTRSLDT